jgi:hypothetical protein
MAIDAEIEAAVVAMRAVRVEGAKVHGKSCEPPPAWL